MERDGVVGEVLIGGPWGALCDPEVGLPWAQIMNDWLADTYRDHLDQFAPSIHLPLYDAHVAGEGARASGGHGAPTRPVARLLPQPSVLLAAVGAALGGGSRSRRAAGVPSERHAGRPSQQVPGRDGDGRVRHAQGPHVRLERHDHRPGGHLRGGRGDRWLVGEQRCARASSGPTRRDDRVRCGVAGLADGLHGLLPPAAVDRTGRRHAAGRLRRQAAEDRRAAEPLRASAGQVHLHARRRGDPPPGTSPGSTASCGATTTRTSRGRSPTRRRP